MPYMWHTSAMRTTLDIDDEILSSLMEISGEKTKTAAIEDAISYFLAHEAAMGIRNLRGSIEVEDVSAELRRQDRSS